MPVKKKNYDTELRKAKTRANVLASKLSATVSSRCKKGRTRKADAIDEIYKDKISKLNKILSGKSRDNRIIKQLFLAASTVADYAVLNAPFKNRTWKLRKSIKATVPQKLASGTWKCYVQATAQYAGYVEYRPGLWVLSGAMEAKRGAVRRILGVSGQVGDLYATNMSENETGGALKIKISIPRK